MAKATASFEILNEVTRQDYQVVMDAAIVKGSIERQQGAVTAISGTAYEKNEQGEPTTFIGTFSGRMVDGGMMYSFSEMNHEQAEIMWAAIAVIEANIFNEPAAE